LAITIKKKGPFFKGVEKQNKREASALEQRPLFLL